MKMKLIHRKNIKPVLFLILLLFTCVIGGTIAYFTYRERFANEFKVKGYDLNIEEEFGGTFGTKRVSITNQDEADVILRISYNEEWSKGNLLLSSEINGTEVVKKAWTDVWKNDFVLGPDGWYYYKKILKANSSIQILESIAFNESLAKLSSNYEYYKEYDYSLTFNYEAVQTTSKAVKELWGVDVVINENDLTWSWN